MARHTIKEAIRRAAAGAGSSERLAAQLGTTARQVRRWAHGEGRPTLYQWQVIARLALVKLEHIDTTGQRP